MTDISVFREAQRQTPRPGTKGWWETIDLDPERRAALEAAVDDLTISARAIEIVLKSWGHQVNAAAVAHYRRRKHG